MRSRDNFDILMGLEDLNISSVVTKEIPGHDGYRAGTDGSIWSRMTNGLWTKLKCTINKDTNRKCCALKDAAFTCAYFVLVTFVGPRPTGLEACHNDGNSLNDEVSNLRWDTRTGNMADTLKHGTRMCGEKHPNAKITNEQADEIVLRKRNGTDTKTLAKEYDLHPSRIDAIVRGERTKLPERQD